MTKRLIGVFIGISLILVFCSLVYAESENYCQDKDKVAKNAVQSER